MMSKKWEIELTEDCSERHGKKRKLQKVNWVE